MTPNATEAQPKLREAPSGKRKLSRRSVIVLAGLVLIVCSALAVWYVRTRNDEIVSQVEDAGGRYFAGRSMPLLPGIFRQLAGGPKLVSHTIRFAPGRVTDAWLERNRSRIEALSELQLQLRSPSITDNGVRHLTNAWGITDLNLSDTAITDSGLATLTGLPQLRSLSVRGTRITDNAVATLNRLPLRSINLADTEITDAGISQLNLPSLYGIAMHAGQLTTLSMQSPLLKRQLLAFELRGADDDSVAQLVDLVLSAQLTIQGEGVTDASVPVLKSLLQNGTWYSLSLVDSQITEDGLKELRMVNFGCRVHRMSTSDLDRIQFQSTTVSNPRLY